MKPAPLFVTGTGRSGSTLLCRMLAAHPEIMVAADAYFPLFRALRDAILEETNDPIVQRFVARPFQDYYYGEDRLLALDAVQHGSVDLRCGDDLWPSLRQAIAARASHEAADLVPHVSELRGRTYREAFTNAIDLVARARKSERCKWVGCKEVWVIELFAAFARAFPDARFVVIVRDPRAVLASLLAIADRDPSQRAHALSYLRHWRKYVAFVEHYRVDPLFERRLHVFTYENLVTTARETVATLCDFLEVAPHADMLDPDRYIDHGSGQLWAGNSAFAPEASNAPSKRLSRWRQTMTPSLLHLTEIVTAPEMRLMGYDVESIPEARNTDSSVLAWLRMDDRRELSWRSDLGDPELDHRLDVAREKLLDEPELAEGTLRRSFLFPEVFRRLHALKVRESRARC